jgi:hypothetical protein
MTTEPEIPNTSRGKCLLARSQKKARSFERAFPYYETKAYASGSSNVAGIGT